MHASCMHAAGPIRSKAEEHVNESPAKNGARLGERGAAARARVYGGRAGARRCGHPPAAQARRGAGRSSNAWAGSGAGRERRCLTAPMERRVRAGAAQLALGLVRPIVEDIERSMAGALFFFSETWPL